MCTSLIVQEQTGLPIRGVILAFFFPHLKIKMQQTIERTIPTANSKAKMVPPIAENIITDIDIRKQIGKCQRLLQFVNPIS